MPHPLVLQLRFTRSEFLRALDGVTDDEARQRVMPMNCIGWNVGHLAWQEQRYWLWRGQGQMPLPELQELFVAGAPASTPSLAAMLEDWRTITTLADPWLDQLTTDRLQERHTHPPYDHPFYTFGSLMQRTLYHYWYHIGENLAIRQMLGHTNLPFFVGNIDDEAPYQPEL